MTYSVNDLSFSSFDEIDEIDEEAADGLDFDLYATSVNSDFDVDDSFLGRIDEPGWFDAPF